MCVLVAPPQTAVPRSKTRWIVAGAVIFCILLIAGILFAVHNWPFTQQAITQALEDASGRKVEIRGFSSSYFPPGCTAQGVRFLRHKHPDRTPVIEIQKLIIRSTYTGLIGSPTRLSMVKAVGMHVLVPPTQPGQPAEPVPLNSGPGAKSVAISQIVADDALVEFYKQDRKAPPFVLKIVHLRIGDVGFDKPMSYDTVLLNTEPPGTIRATGQLGPWNSQDAGATPVAGKYTYSNIALSHFESVFGVGQASGEFSGPLAKIHTTGRVDVAGFRVDGSNHETPLSTTYDATVNGTNGDVELHPAVAQFRHTRIEVRGLIAARQNEDAKTANFDFTVPQGRVEDLLELFTSGPAGMRGQVAVNGKFLWPPGPRRFLEKISIDMACGMHGSRFTSTGTQDSINRISESAQGEKKKQEDNDPRTVLSQIHGSIHISNGIAAVSNTTFQVPGADADVHGSYNLLNHHVDLHGTLDTRGSLADATSGFKAVILKAVTPLFKKRGPVRIIPFSITGNYSNAAVSIDWKHGLIKK